MSKKVVTLLIAGLVVMAAPGLASSFGLYGSYWDTDALGETAGGGAKLSFGGGPLQFELRGTYFPDLSEDFSELIDSDDDLFDFEVEATTLEAGITFNLAPDSSFSPYIGGGASYYLLDTNVFEIDDEVGYYGVLGFEAGSSDGGVGFFAEALYRVVEGTVAVDPDEIDDIDDIDIDDEVSLELEGISVNAGIVFRF